MPKNFWNGTACSMRTSFIKQIRSQLSKVLLCSKVFSRISTSMTKLDPWSMATAKTSVTGYYCMGSVESVYYHGHIIQLYSFSTLPGNRWHVHLINHVHVILQQAIRKLLLLWCYVLKNTTLYIIPVLAGLILRLICGVCGELVVKTSCVTLLFVE